MQLIIDIPEQDYRSVSRIVDMGLGTNVDEAIKNGTPIPKGHGRIVDIGRIDNDRIEKDNPVIYLTVNGEYIEAVSLDYLNGLPTIIEADK